MVSTGEIKRGMTIELDGNLYQIVEFQHIKMGRGSAQVRMKLRNVRRGDLIEKTFQAGDRFARARLDHRDVQYMYHDGDLYHFMDTKTFDQVALDAGACGRRQDGRRSEHAGIKRHQAFSPWYLPLYPSAVGADSRKNTSCATRAPRCRR